MVFLGTLNVWKRKKDLNSTLQGWAKDLICEPFLDVALLFF